jgi:hypothetical protein
MKLKTCVLIVFYCYFMGFACSVNNRKIEKPEIFKVDSVYLRVVDKIIYRLKIRAVFCKNHKNYLKIVKIWKFLKARVGNILKLDRNSKRLELKMKKEVVYQLNIPFPNFNKTRLNE